MFRFIYTLFFAVALPVLAEQKTYGPQLEGFDYPFPVEIFQIDSQGQQLEMAYMDIQPQTPNGMTVVLLHGKNFCAATWEGTIHFLIDNGYRVIAPDQIGFCKSSKPEQYQYSFHQLSANTSALLKQLDIENHIIMGHSMGGMLATRHTLLNPDKVKQLVMVNPIGLEDWLAKGVPYREIDDWYQSELKTNADSIRQYQQNTYYAGNWEPGYDRWVEMQAGLFQGSGKEIVAWNSALTYDMVLTQPVFYEFENLQVPTLLLIGEQDNTAVGKNLAPEAKRAQLGNYSKISREVAERIPQATLVAFADLGHSPQIQDAERFHQSLLEHLLPY
ncbi:alpha/beta fold hydrolase [Methylophaga sp.]|uniref:alpha/beta fold hydrolase n=1 Tax=Methylophaga sp. TaxID=2024840 RepID=UPI002727B460|nr:alpha/beta hydrolase [Methylophaga sp.]MDO8826131.1 alpha/beta hydrolase [Methylophaga sp.]